MNWHWQKGSGRWSWKFYAQVPVKSGGVANYGAQIWRTWICEDRLEICMGPRELIITWPAPMRMEQS